jgi:hypothetical protein
MEPFTTLTSGMIATLVITKAFEKTGEKLGEKVLEEIGKFLSLPNRKAKEIANKIKALAQTKPLDYGQAFVIGQQMEEAAKKDPEIAEAVENVANAVEPSVIQNFINNFTNTITVDKNYGGNAANNINIENQTNKNTFNI